jgi:hypothetical protein
MSWHRNKVWIRWGAPVLLVVLYFGLIRPTRSWITKRAVEPFLRVQAEGNPAVYVEEYDQSQVFTIGLTHAEKEAVYYKFGFGLFFLVSGFVLLALGVDSAWLEYLVLLHALGVFLVFVSFWVGVRWSVYGLYVGEMLKDYVVPAFSLILVPLAAEGRGETSCACGAVGLDKGME